MYLFSEFNLESFRADVKIREKNFIHQYINKIN